MYKKTSFVESSGSTPGFTAAAAGERMYQEYMQKKEAKDLEKWRNELFPIDDNDGLPLYQPRMPGKVPLKVSKDAPTPTKSGTPPPKFKSPRQLMYEDRSVWKHPKLETTKKDSDGTPIAVPERFPVKSNQYFEDKKKEVRDPLHKSREQLLEKRDWLEKHKMKSAKLMREDDDLTMELERQKHTTHSKEVPNAYYRSERMIKKRQERVQRELDDQLKSFTGHPTASGEIVNSPLRDGLKSDAFSPSTMTKRKSLIEISLGYTKHETERIEKLQIKYKDSKQESCSFKPSLNPRSKQIVKRQRQLAGTHSYLSPVGHTSPHIPSGYMHTPMSERQTVEKDGIKFVVPMSSPPPALHTPTIYQEIIGHAQPIYSTDGTLYSDHKASSGSATGSPYPLQSVARNSSSYAAIHLSKGRKVDIADRSFVYNGKDPQKSD
ncbi:hypothetical protein ADUPG1_009855, partial [Aduncisulcus paluster]